MGGGSKSKITELGINRSDKGKSQREFFFQKGCFVLQEWDVCFGCIIYAESWSQADVREQDGVGNESP